MSKIFSLHRIINIKMIKETLRSFFIRISRKPGMYFISSTSQFGLATPQVLHRHLWMGATVLDPAGLYAHKCQILISIPQVSRGSRPPYPVPWKAPQTQPAIFPSSFQPAVPSGLTSVKTPSSTQLSTLESCAFPLALPSPSATHLVLSHVTTSRL